MLSHFIHKRFEQPWVDNPEAPKGVIGKGIAASPPATPLTVIATEYTLSDVAESRSAASRPPKKRSETSGRLSESFAENREFRMIDNNRFSGFTAGPDRSSRPSMLHPRIPSNPGLTRRELLGAGAISIVAGSSIDVKEAFYDVTNAVMRDAAERQEKAAAPSVSPNSKIQAALIGAGSRGYQLLRAHGFWPPLELAKAGISKPPYPVLDSVEVVAVCDVYLPNIQRALTCLEPFGRRARTVRDWREIVADPSIDCVVIATIDAWHAPIAIAALKAGKHVYVEKCMTHTFEQALELKKAVAENPNSILQVGHQNRHNTYHEIACRLIKNGTIGAVSSVEMGLCRQTKDGAYASATPRELAGGGNDNVLAWDLFFPPGVDAKRVEDRWTNWRKYWDLSTGIAGDLMSHDVDALNLFVNPGIPDSVVASGGVYVWKDGRETPDVYSVIHEFPDHNLSMTYNCTFGSSQERKTRIYGRDGMLVVSFDLNVFPDYYSTRYAKDIASRKMRAEEAFIKFDGPAHDPKLKTSPSAAWADGKGLTFTMVGEKQADVTRLAIEEFYQNVRGKSSPRCGINEGFTVAATCHMGTMSLREGRKIRFDKKTERLV